MVTRESLSAYNSTRHIATEQQDVVLDVLRASTDGLIREEIAELAGTKLQSETVRISELLANGSVVQKLRSSPDEKGSWYQTRLTTSGKRAAVLVAR